MIADCPRFERINKEVYLGDYHYKALQGLTRARYFAVQNLTKEKQRFINVLFKKYSSFTQEKVFSDTFSTTALAVYEEFESAEVLAISITSIKALESQIKELDKAIAAQMELLPNVLSSIKGIGPVYSAGIMAEIGDINRFEDQVNRYQHKRALALTARKFVRLVFRLLKDNHLYHPAE